MDEARDEMKARGRDARRDSALCMCAPDFGVLDALCSTALT